MADDFAKRYAKDIDLLRSVSESIDLAAKLQSLDARLPGLSGATRFEHLLRLPDPPKMPERWEMPDIPGPEEANSFQSAGVMLQRLARTLSRWREELPSDAQPAVMAILHGGVQLAVDRLSEEGFHGVRIEGRVNDVPCMLLAHQSTVQLLCFVRPVKPPESPRRPIGFVISGNAFET